jgi:elongation factor P hydroxylase
MTIEHRYQDLIALFNDEFEQDYRTRLVKGEDEPIYLPADDITPYHQIVFAHGFYASALHEISHWCIAGERRRQLVDYGYWYCPDGRSADKQAEFEQVEIKPQALDWLFCSAADYPFNVSCDNLDGDFQPDRIAFQRKVHAQVLSYLESSPPTRAVRFMARLQDFYGTPLRSAEYFRSPECDSPLTTE